MVMNEHAVDKPLGQLRRCEFKGSAAKGEDRAPKQTALIRLRVFEQPKQRLAAIDAPFANVRVLGQRPGAFGTNTNVVLDVRHLFAIQNRFKSFFRSGNL